MINTKKHRNAKSELQAEIYIPEEKTIPRKSSVVWEDDLQKLAIEWFKKNPGWTISQVANQAVRKFMTSPFTTEPVELVPATKQNADKMMDKMLAKHVDALERLK